MSDTLIKPSASTALVLGGGGARAAYQVGVLDAISQILKEMGKPTSHSPFHILSGTSAGAINVAYLASHSDHFDQAIRELLEVWENFSPADVYRTDLLGSAANALHWVGTLSMGWLIRESPRALFDNSPLRGLINKHIDFASIEKAIAQGKLDALAINASSYSSGHHVTFYQSQKRIKPWSRTQRQAAETSISLDHLMASSAIPFIFPAIRLMINKRSEYFGDGAMRQSAPISPAIHLGATRIVAIGAGQTTEHEGSDLAESSSGQTEYPGLGQISGHVLASIFLDGMASDVERLERINRTLQIMTAQQEAESGLRRLELLSITPSQRLDTLAEPFVRNLPRSVRSVLKLLGATGSRGTGLASYLLFDKNYTQCLIELGRKDGLDCKRKIVEFFLEYEPCQ